MTATVWHTPESRDDWLALRRGVLTSTEIGALFGVSPYATPFSLWWSKRGDSPLPERAESERMTAGKYLEPAIAAWYADETGAAVERAGLTFATRPDLRLGASFDCFVTLPEFADQRALLEIKNVDFLIYRDQWIDECRDGVDVLEPPHHLLLQVQTQLLVSGAPFCDLAVLIGGNRLRWTRMLPDPELQCRIVGLAADFWASQDADTAPPPDCRRDLPTLRELYPSRLDMLDPDPAGAARLADACARYDAARSMGKALEADQDAAAAELVHVLGEHEGAWLDGYRLTRRADKRGRRTLRVTAVSTPAKEAA